MLVDFSRYKRLFAFGCSFTSYGWPTWADLIGLQHPHKEYYNHGFPGLGNIAIASRISEANNRYRFDENDLVMVMWSTFCREDHWANGNWIGCGNIYNSDYSKDWLKKYADPIGYLIRDHAIINMTNKFLKQSKFGSLILKSTPLLYTELPIDKTDHDVVNDITLLYGKEYNSLPIDLYNFMGKDWAKCTQKYYDDTMEKPEMRYDCHPYSSVYADYLMQVGIHLDDKVLELAKESDKILLNCKTKTELIHAFPYLSTMQSKLRTGFF